MYKNKKGFVLLETCICLSILSMLVLLTTSIVNRLSQSKIGQQDTINELEQDLELFMQKEIKCLTEEVLY